MTRREEIAAGLAHTRERIAAACDAAGRAPDEVTLIVVTKFFPVDDVLVLLDLGSATSVSPATRRHRPR